MWSPLPNFIGTDLIDLVFFLLRKKRHRFYYFYLSRTSFRDVSWVHLGRRVRGPIIIGYHGEDSQRLLGFLRGKSREVISLSNGFQYSSMNRVTRTAIAPQIKRVVLIDEIRVD